MYKLIKNIVCPITKEGLYRQGDFLITLKSGIKYPIIDGIPCFTKTQVSM
ncbi:hypothetical protein pb186bvf_001509 [Paramecium bursaria]